LLVMFANLIWGAIKGPRAPRNPWGGATLEWQAASPPVTDNFDRPIDLTRQAYDYPREVDHG
jgi:cytochrome c oxidase subunit 1